LGEELSVVLEIDAEHDRNAEDELSMRDGIKDVVGDVFPELNGLLGMATGAEPPALAGKGDEEFMPAIRVGAAHPGKSLVQIATSQVFLDHFVHNRPEEPLLLLAMLVIAGLKIRIVVVQYLPQGRICWLSWVIDW
jgi:hypothetical protein